MNEAARNQLVVDHMDFVHKIALSLKRRLPSESNDLDDLVQEGMLGLIAAASRYSSTLNDNFEAYAFMRVKGAMLDSLRRQHWFESTMTQIVPVEVVDDVAYDHRQWHGLMAEPLADEGLQPRNGVISGSDLSESEAQAERGHHRRALDRAEAAELNAREQRIFDLYYRDGKTEREIAPSLHVSESRIGQMRRRALTRMRGRCRSLGLAVA